MLSPTKIGRYEVVSALGQGAMGTVYKAIDPLIERAVAIKTINLTLSREERAEFEERFYREAKSAGRLSHANIVTIYDVGETDDVAYIAMEFLEGQSLREVLDSGVVLPIEMICRIVGRIANALDYAHEHHVVHRDIKPANIMVTSNRNVKIMDFGIAQIPTGSRTQLGTVLGSPKYMAPEQVAGKPADGRADIFALGVVLYEMLTGTTPFNGDNLSAIMYKILNEEPAPPSTANPRVPPVFDRIISRALAKRPEDRYQTAREFARNLRNPDATPLQDAHRPAASSHPAKAILDSGTPAGQQDATLLLPPKQAREVIAIPPPGKGPGIGETKPALAGRAQQGRKSLLLAIPALAVAAFVLHSQGRQPNSGEVAAPVTPVLEAMPGKAPQSAGTPAQLLPASLATSAVASAPAVTAAGSDPSPAPAKQAKSTVTFAISPWGEVYVDGKNVGASPPLAALQLAAGKHRVEIRNQAFAPYRDTVNLEPGQSLKVRHKFK